MNTEDKNIIRTIVVDDSAFIRKSLTLMLESDPGIKVIAVAKDGKEGLEKIINLKPDIVTLDIDMPGMDGLTVLKLLMEQMPIPVLIVSSLTTESAIATIKAFELGAVDFISKDLSVSSANIKKIKDELIDKVKLIARSRLIQTRFRMRRLAQASTQKKTTAVPKARRVTFESIMLNLQAVLIGISTGGPQALLKMIPQIPKDFPLGIAIAQHMPPKFTRTLADRINAHSKLLVKEAENGESLEPGKILIAPGGKQMTFVNNNQHNISIKISDEPSNILYKPSIDLMMTSAANTFKAPLLGIIMTGMGKDGIQGLKHIRAREGFVIAQDEDSCIVYGMPKAACDAGIVDASLSLDEITTAFKQLTETWIQTHAKI